MNKLSFILLQDEARTSYGNLISSLFIVLIVFLVCAAVFLLIRSIVLWYWKVDVIVRNQQDQTSLLQTQNQLLKEQNTILKEFKDQMKNNSIDPNK
jgi:large-conductance mechanosensitive channel